MSDREPHPALRQRPFAHADAEQVEVWLQGPGIAVPPGRAGRQWAVRMLADSRIIARTFLQGTEPIAFGRLDIGPDGVAELTIAVAPLRRRQGLGREVLKRMLDEARRRSVSRVHAMVDQANQAARVFFLASGFEESGGDSRSLRLVRHLHGSAAADPIEIEV